MTSSWRFSSLSAFLVAISLLWVSSLASRTVHATDCINKEEKDISEEEKKIRTKCSDKDPSRTYRLDLNNSTINDQDMQALAQVPLPRLLDLYLGANRIRAEGIQALSQAQWSSLECLDLGHNDIGDAGMRALSQLQLPHLLCLDLGHNGIGDAGMRDLVQAQRYPYLYMRHLGLAGNRIGDQGIGALSQLQCPKLQNLILPHNKIGDEGITMLTRKQWLCLENLSLAANKIGDEGAMTLLQLSSPKLRGLCLAFNKIGPKGAKQLLVRTPWPLLQALKLTHNPHWIDREKFPFREWSSTVMTWYPPPWKIGTTEIAHTTLKKKPENQSDDD